MENKPLETGEAMLVQNDLPATYPLEGDAMRFLYELGCKSRDYTVRQINGATYVNTLGLERIAPYEQPDPRELKGIFTLTGLVEYLKADVDAHFARYDHLHLIVTDPTRVEVWTPVHGEERSRALLAVCTFERPRMMLNDYMDQERFSVMVQTHFDDGENRANVLRIAGNIRMQAEAELADDGVTQKVTVKDGITLINDMQIINPVLLAPHRIFPEIEQPSSPFILRVRKGTGGAEIALFEADSAAWKVDAVRMIGGWLRDMLADVPVVVIA
jgi:hypothetical protein